MGYFYQDTFWNTAFDHKASYTYDGVNRLLTAVATPYSPGTISYNLTFSNDAYGNMTCVTNGQTVGLCPVLTFNSNNQAVTLQGANSNFSYDAAGDMTTDVATTRNYAWDAEGRLYQAGSHGQGFSDRGFFQSIKSHGWESTNRGYLLRVSRYGERTNQPSPISTRRQERKPR
jgi:hypothetical protein